MPPSVPAPPHTPLRGAAGAQRGPRRPSAPGRVLGGVAAGGLLLGLVLGVRTGWGDVPSWACPALTLVLLAAHLSSQPGAPRSRRWPFSLSEGVLAAAFAVSPGAWTVGAAGGAVLLAGLRRPQPRLKRDVDLARAVLAAAAGQAVAGALGGGVAAAGAGLVVLEAVGCLVTAVAVCVTSSRPLGSLLVSSATGAASHTAASAAVGLLAGWLLLEAPAGLLGLAVPLLLLRSSYDTSSRRGAEVRLLAELATGQAGPGQSQDVQSALLVTTTARLLGGADVELVLLATDGPVLLVGDESGAPQRQRVRAEVFDEPWVLRALGRPGAGCGRDGDRPYLSTVLGAPDHPVGVLRARRGPDARGFERRELRLVDVLVAQSAAWLGAPEGADGRLPSDGGRTDVTALAGGRGPGATSDAGTADAGTADAGTADAGTADAGTADAGTADVETTAALHALAASADRLGRLAGRPGEVDDVVDELVEEVHLAQRAVASVLGARALAVPVPRSSTPATGDAAVGAGRGTEWTTTGVLR